MKTAKTPVWYCKLFFLGKAKRFIRDEKGNWFTADKFRRPKTKRPMPSCKLKDKLESLYGNRNTPPPPRGG